MKKKTLSVLLFVITFIATYTILCFALPGAKDGIRDYNP